MATGVPKKRRSRKPPCLAEEAVSCGSASHLTYAGKKPEADVLAAPRAQLHFPLDRAATETKPIACISAITCAYWPGSLTTRPCAARCALCTLIRLSPPKPPFTRGNSTTPTKTRLPARISLNRCAGD